MFSKSQGSVPVSEFNPEAGIRLSAVSKSYETSQQQISVLSEITADISQKTTAILGLNGSGKSTLLKLFNGLEVASSGSVQVGYLEVDNHIKLIRQKVGFLFANPAAQLVMPTGIEDVELSLRASITDRRKRAERALEILSLVGMADRAHHSVYDLSGGERQLIALATVLAVQPSILLLDEPTTLLDLRNRQKLMNILQELPQQLVISTHDLELAGNCDEVLVLNNGSLLAQGSPQEIIHLYRSWCADGFPGESC